MHLDEPILVGRRRRAEEDEEDEVAEVLELRPLAEVCGVLERKGMKLEDVAEEREFLLTRAVQVEPEATKRSCASWDCHTSKTRIWPSFVTAAV